MDKRRTFLRHAIVAGLDCGVLHPDDVLRHITPLMLATHLPKGELARLIARALEAESFDASAVVDVLGVPVLAEHMPVFALWRIVDDAAAQALEGAALPERAAKKADEAPESAGDGKGKSQSKSRSDKKGSKKKGRDDKAARDDKKDQGRPAKEPGSSREPARARESASAKESGSPNQGKKPKPAKQPGGAKEVSEPSGAPKAPGSAAKGSETTPSVQAAPPRKPNVSSRPETEPGPAKRAKESAVRQQDEPTADLQALPDFDVDTKVNQMVPEPVGGPPPRAPTVDPEVEDALAGLEMENDEEEIILDEEFEIAEEEILDDSINFDDIR